jgi:hypothetical protein
MPLRPLPIVGGWYTDDALPWTQQDCCNYIPVIAEQPGAISQVKAIDAPGPKPFVEIASDGGIRGLRDVEGKLMVVAGTTLYQITNALIAIPRGTVPGTGPVTMSHNQQGIANELLIGNGSAGYVYNTATLVFNRIIDPGYPGTKATDYLDSYLLGVEPLGRFWFHSDLADAESYNTLDRYEAETSPDRIVTLAVSNEEVVVFGQRTVDFFVNTGASTGTFQSKGVSCNVGCAGTNAVVKLDNTLMWLDNYGVFQRLDGYTPVPISTRALESAISGANWSNVVATTYQDRGRKIAYWTFPNGLTFGYDVTTRLWHRLESYGKTNFRAPQIVYWNRKWIAGDSQTGRLYELDWDYMLDVDQPHVRKLKTAPLHGAGVKLQAHAIKLIFDGGGPVTVAIPFPVQPEGPTIFVPPLPDGSVGLPWAGGTFTATGGTPPYSFSQRPGTTYPGNLGPMNSAGVVAAETPGAIGVGTVIARVTDANDLFDEISDTFMISAVMVVAGDPVNPTSQNAAYSSAAESWIGVPDATMPLAAAAAGYGNGRWALVARNEGWYSDNLITWTQSAFVPNTGSFTLATAYGNGVFLTVGSSGLIYRSVNNSVDYAAITDTGANYLSAAYGNGLWIVGVEGSASGPYRTSEDDGLTFTQGSLVFPYQVSCALWNGERWAVAGGESSPTLPGGVKTSVNGASWSAGIVSPSRVSSITYGNGIWVAICEGGEIIYSNDDWVSFGTSATTVSSSSRSNQVCFNGQLFVLCDGNDYLDGFTRSSADGNEWSEPVTTAIADNLIIVSSYEYE